MKPEVDSSDIENLYKMLENFMYQSTGKHFDFSEGVDILFGDALEAMMVEERIEALRGVQEYETWRKQQDNPKMSALGYVSLEIQELETSLKSKLGDSNE